MKSATEYFETNQGKAFDDNGAFWAFSQSQFDEKRKSGVHYVSLGGGLICPKENAPALVTALKQAHKEGVAADLAENGKEGVIRRELYNHECFYTMSTEDVEDRLKDYGITPEEIKAVFKSECSVIDWDKY